MGHLFRGLNLAIALLREGYRAKIFVNDDAPARRFIERAGVEFDTVEPSDLESGWEAKKIARDGIKVWINDRLDTEVRHASHIRRAGVSLVTFDDRGTGAALANLNIVAMAFDPAEKLPGRHVLRGVDYLVLNPAIAAHRRVRRHAQRWLVSLGGTDTHGVTLKVIRCLRAENRAATIILGPGFRHEEELMVVSGPDLEVKRGVPSLVAEFEGHDVAITGGGITPFEANATGLPCIVIANEKFEVPVGIELARLGGSIFAGHYATMDVGVFRRALPVQEMSEAGIAHIGLHGTKRVIRELTLL